MKHLMAVTALAAAFWLMGNATTVHAGPWHFHYYGGCAPPPPCYHPPVCYHGGYVVHHYYAPPPPPPVYRSPYAPYPYGRSNVSLFFGF